MDTYRVTNICGKCASDQVRHPKHYKRVLTVHWGATNEKSTLDECVKRVNNV